MCETRAEVVALGSEHRLNELDRQVWLQRDCALDRRAGVLRAGRQQAYFDRMLERTKRGELTYDLPKFTG